MEEKTEHSGARNILEITPEELNGLAKLIVTRVNRLCSPHPDMTDEQREAGLEMIKIAAKCSELAAMLKAIDIKEEDGVKSVNVSAGQAMARCILITAIALLSSFFITLKIDRALDLTAMIMMLTADSRLDNAKLHVLDINELIAPAEGGTVH